MEQNTALALAVHAPSRIHCQLEGQGHATTNHVEGYWGELGGIGGNWGELGGIGGNWGELVGIGGNLGNLGTLKRTRQDTAIRVIVRDWAPSTHGLFPPSAT